MKKLWQKRNSAVHGRGLFASVYIKKGTEIIEYIGDKVNKKEGDKRAWEQMKRAKKNKKNGMVYVFQLNKKYDIDGGVLRNHARLINHSCKPNCEVVITENRLWINSTKNIKKGTEITYNYGYPYDEDYTDHVCKCGSNKCVGYILDEDEWPKLKTKLKKIK
tara:strand:- start:169 stop:654 length:486 start_codon:yes stop_codon:yes gene_type:complete